VSKPKIILNNDHHRGNEVITLKFDFDRDLIEEIKKLKGSRWSQTKKCWYLPSENFDLNEVFTNLKEKAFIDYSAIKHKQSSFANTNIKLDTAGDDSNPVQAVQFDKIMIHCDERENTLYLNLPYNLKETFKKLEGAWWHPKRKQWSALDTPENRQHLNEILFTAGLRSVYKTETSKPGKKPRTPKFTNPVLPDKKLLRYFEIENKAQSTIKQYSWYITWFLTHYRDKDLTEDPGELVHEFLHKQLLGSGYGKTAQNIALSALQNYYRIIFNIDLHTADIPRPKQKRTLPKVLSAGEFISLYQSCDNSKHKIILKLMYGCGLRRNEVCELRTENVDIEREIIFVKGKGNKIRALNPGKRLLEDMKEYLEIEKPGEYFIRGQYGGKYAGSSIGKMIERLAEKAGIKRKVTPHMLRHTFATHHMERGTELRLIQEALGHASSKTTEIYTWVSRSNIKKMPNLLDDLDL